MVKILDWLKQHWMHLINYLVIIIAYSIIYGHTDIVWAEFLLGIWLFVSAAFAGYRWFNKKPKIN